MHDDERARVAEEIAQAIDDERHKYGRGKFHAYFLAGSVAALFDAAAIARAHKTPPEPSPQGEEHAPRVRSSPDAPRGERVPEDTAAPALSDAKRADLERRTVEFLSELAGGDWHDGRGRGKAAEALLASWKELHGE